MWKKVKCCCEWDMAWFCSKCEKMMYWKTKGWNNPNIAHYNFYCEDCKKKIEENGCKYLKKGLNDKLDSCS